MIAIGSREYWRDPASYPDDWQLRAAQAALFVEPVVSVLDIGCGAGMTLRKYLPGGCVYIPADLVKWAPEVRHVDVDAGIFPEGEFDYVILLGVIEYLNRPEL